MNLLLLGNDMATITLKLATDTYEDIIQELVWACRGEVKGNLSHGCPIKAFKCPFHKDCSKITKSDWINVIQGVAMNKFNVGQEVICHFGTKEVEGTIKECTYYDEYDSYVYLVYINDYRQVIGFLEHHIKEKNNGN